MDLADILDRAMAVVECLGDDLILRFVARRATAAERARVDAHIDNCTECRSALAEAARVVVLGERAGVAGDESPVPAPGERIHRYEIVDILGVGGAGVVYRAFDPELRRHVALKLIRPDSTQSEPHHAQSLLLREARAMAQLAHPNVVGIHDAGTFGSQVFLVMELVEGRTLGEWLRAAQPEWRAIIEVFLEAGRGLAAAHEAGLVHRDFKLENVLIGEDARVRVTDFGLARSTAPSTGGGEPGEQTRLPHSGAAPRADTGQIDTGQIVTRLAGTPAYMAPEQFLGGATDARTDQFSFCVALHLALYGRHPFGATRAGDDVMAVAAERALRGEIEPAIAGSQVPQNLREVILRGLQPMPERRFATLNDLLADLARQRAPLAGPVWSNRRFVWPVLAFVGIAAGGATWFIGSRNAARLAVPAPGSCGNGSLEPGEQCDDGNTLDQDGCLANCRFATCGDGKVRAHVEACDDGNQRNGDGCDRCITCGGGNESFVWSKNGHCYSRHDVQLSFADARALCAQTGGDLAAYGSGHEAITVFEALHAHDAKPVWIGIHAGDPGGRAAWVSGTEFVMNSLSVDGSFPEHARCGLQQTGRVKEGYYYPMHWRPTPCGQAAGALCETSAWIVRPKDNHAYVILSLPVTFAAARVACASRGAHLATIGDAEEQAFAGAHVFTELWLGATDEREEGVFKWLTGEPFRFRAFSGNEPDDRDAANCLVMGRDKEWHDRGCNLTYGALCEVD